MTRTKSKLDLNKKKRKRDKSKSTESDELQRSNLSEQGKSPSTPPKRKELKVTETGASAWSLLETATLFTNSRSLNKTCTNANELTISESISNQLSEEREKNNIDNELTLDEAEWKKDIDEMIQLAPTVLHNLALEGLEKTIPQFFRQVASGVFPLHNIAFLLWVEMVRWYDNTTSTNMRYFDQTKKFWKLGWRIFGGKFIRFMTLMK